MKVLIIGGGKAGRRHADICRDFGCDVRIWDSQQERCVGSGSWDVDRIFICTPPAEHLYYAGRAIESGIPTFIEKPLGVPAQIKKWELLAQKAPETVVGYQLRFHPDYYSMFGATGLVFARFWYGNNIINWRPDYRESYISKPHVDGGGIVAEVSHELDICQAIFGMPVKVGCVGRSCEDMAEEIKAVAALEYEEGTCHVWMDGVLMQRSQGMWATFSDGSEIEIRSGELDKMKEAYRKQDEYFLKGYPPRSSILTALDTLRLISACHKSMKGLRLVSIAERQHTRSPEWRV